MGNGMYAQMDNENSNHMMDHNKFNNPSFNMPNQVPLNNNLFNLNQNNNLSTCIFLKLATIRFAMHYQAVLIENILILIVYLIWITNI